MNKLTNHGDHYTTGEETRAGWLSIIVQPQQALNGSTIFVAHGWRHGQLVGSESSLETPEAAAAMLVAFADSADAWERVDAFWSDMISLDDCPHDDDWCEHETEHPQGIKR